MLEFPITESPHRKRPDFSFDRKKEAPLATCARCETQKNIRAILLQEVLRATALCDEAVKEFDEVTSQMGPLNPDPKHRIVDAVRELTIARNEVLMAHNRLSNCMEQEDFPSEELKRRATA